jgi:predicted dehydrogenase
MNLSRRSLLKTSAAASVASLVSSFPAIRAAGAPSKKIRCAVVALGRGMAHVNAILACPNTEIAYVAEVDSGRLENGLKVIASKQSAPCKGVKDFRSFLDDKSLDAVFIATPNFWHTPAAVLAMQAGKHVFVEKPGSQNPFEAELIVASSRKHQRLVQMGNQRRTWMKEAIQHLRTEKPIGEVFFARSFYYASRKAIAQQAIKPAGDLDLDLWQGPVANERDIKPYVHYDWHWLWHWGNGELGNNGIHTLDVLRWGLGVDYPSRVSYHGSRYRFQDTQETPDTGSALFDFGKVGMEWVQSSTHPRAAEKPVGECVFYGEGGTFVISGPAWTVYDPKGVKVSEGKGPGGGDPAHFGNFLDAIRGEAQLNSPIDEGQKSAMLCHLGNIAYRTRSVLQPDPKTGRITGHAEAEKLWKRAYRTGWEPKA